MTIFKHKYSTCEISRSRGIQTLKQLLQSRIMCFKVWHFSSKLFFFLFVYLAKNEQEDQHKTIFVLKYICTLAKSATAEGIELPSLSGRVYFFFN